MAGKRSIFDERLSGMQVLTVAVGGAAADYTVAAAEHDYFRVLDAWEISVTDSAGATTLTLKNGTNAITNAADINQAVGTVTRCGTISPTYDKVVPGNALIATTNAADSTGILCVLVEPYTA